MKDPLNDKTPFLMKKSFRLSKQEDNIHSESPTGINRRLFYKMITSNNDYGLGSKNAGYLEYTDIPTARPMKP